MSHQKPEQMEAANNISQKGGQANHLSEGTSIISDLQEDCEHNAFLRQAEGYWVLL